MRKFLQFAFVAAMFVMAQSAVAQDVTTVFSESFDAFTEGSEQEAATTDISSGVTNKLLCHLLQCAAELNRAQGGSSFPCGFCPN